MKAIELALQGLSRLDALILASAEHMPETPVEFPRLARFFVPGFAMRRALPRLERRGLIQTGWTTGRQAGHCEVTPLGRQVASTALALMQFEESIDC